MTLYLGNTKIKELYLGSTKIKEAYLGSTLVYRASAYNPNQVVFEESTAGTYTLDLLETGRYEVTVVAGGGGASSSKVGILSVYNGGGASGACFKGEIQITKGSLSIVVGTAGQGSTSRAISNKRGGESSIGSIVRCPSQKDTGHSSTHYAYQNNGAPTVTATIYSTSINAAGNNSNYSESGAARTGGKSVYDNTATGYGAGASTTSGYNSSPANGVAGYVKIVYKS